MNSEPSDLPVGRALAMLARLVDGGLDDVELSSAQYRLLMFLSQGSRAAAVLADHLTVSRPSITSLADGLVARGHIRREADPTDRRRVLHVITDDGRAALARGDAAIAAALETVVAELDPADADAIRRGLAMLLGPLDTLRRTSLDKAASTAPAAGGRA